MNVFENIAKSLFVAGMLPLDYKTYFPTLTQMRDLGVSNSKAFYYYEWMAAICVENGTKYVWIEVEETSTAGVLDQNFLYPANTVSNNIDYSGRYFNFVAEPSATQSAPNVFRPYAIFKDPNNPKDFLEENDVVIGHFSATKFMFARYKGGGPITSPSVWAEIDKFNPKQYN